MSAETQNVLKGLGVIRRRRRHGRDYLGERLVSRFNTPARTFWQCLFGDDYEHALQILLEAEGAFDLDKSHWLQLQNSFNDALVRGFIAYLKRKGLSGAVRTTGGGKLVRFGNILQRGGAFSVYYPVVADAFREANVRRNNLPGSHPYEERGGNRAKWLGKRERDQLQVSMAAAYGAIIAVIDTHGVA